MYLRSSSVEIKSAREIDAMREVGRLAGETLSLIGASIRPGITTDEINRIAHEDTLKKGARPAPLNYRGSSGDTPSPKSIGTSVKDVVAWNGPSSAGVGSRCKRGGWQRSAGVYGRPSSFAVAARPVPVRRSPAPRVSARLQARRCRSCVAGEPSLDRRSPGRKHIPS